GQHQLDGGLALGGVDVHGDATGVVDDLHGAVRPQGYFDGVAVAGHGLVHGVVDDLLDHVVQTALTGGADVHAGALAHRLEPLEDGDVRGLVVLGSVRWVRVRGRGGCRDGGVTARAAGIRDAAGRLRRARGYGLFANGGVAVAHRCGSSQSDGPRSWERAGWSGGDAVPDNPTPARRRPARWPRAHARETSPAGRGDRGRLCRDDHDTSRTCPILSDSGTVITHMA